MTVPFGNSRRRVVGVDVVRHPVEVEVADVADDLRAAVGQNRFDLHRLAAQVEVRLEVRDERVLLQHREAFGRARSSSAGCRGSRGCLEPGEADQIAALLRLLAFRIEPDADFGSGGDLLADGVNVLIPRDLLARQEQLAGAGPEQVVALADRPFHQLRAAVDEVVGAVDAIADRWPCPVFTASGSLFSTRYAIE